MKSLVEITPNAHSGTDTVFLAGRDWQIDESVGGGTGGGGVDTDPDGLTVTFSDGAFVADTTASDEEIFPDNIPTITAGNAWSVTAASGNPFDIATDPFAGNALALTNISGSTIDLSNTPIVFRANFTVLPASGIADPLFQVYNEAGQLREDQGVVFPDGSDTGQFNVSSTGIYEYRGEISQSVAPGERLFILLRETAEDDQEPYTIIPLSIILNEGGGTLGSGTGGGDESGYPATGGFAFDGFDQVSPAGNNNNSFPTDDPDELGGLAVDSGTGAVLMSGGGFGGTTASDRFIVNNTGGDLVFSAGRYDVDITYNNSNASNLSINFEVRVTSGNNNTTTLNPPGLLDTDGISLTASTTGGERSFSRTGLNFTWQDGQAIRIYMNHNLGGDQADIDYTINSIRFSLDNEPFEMVEPVSGGAIRVDSNIVATLTEAGIIELNSNYQAIARGDYVVING